MGLLDDLFGKGKPEFTVPVKDCRNCTFFRPQEGFYGYCSKFNTKLIVNQAPICPSYMAIGQVTARIDAADVVSGVFDEARIPHTFANDVTLASLILDNTILTARWKLVTYTIINQLQFKRWTGSSYDVQFAINESGKIVLGSADASLIVSGVFDQARIPLKFTINLFGSVPASGTIPQRIVLPANKTLSLWLLNRYPTTSDIYAEIYNVSDATTLDSHNDAQHETGNPIHSWSYAVVKVIELRLRNASSSSAYAGYSAWLISID